MEGLKDIKCKWPQCVVRGKKITVEQAKVKVCESSAFPERCPYDHIFRIEEAVEYFGGK